jgi:hypothetical protein
VGQVDSTLVEERQRVRGGLRVDLTGIALQRRDTGCCGGIDAVVLAATAAGEFPDPRGRGRRNIEDDLAKSQQPQRQVVSEPVGVLDRPAALGPGFGPGDQSLVFGEGRLDTK